MLSKTDRDLLAFFSKWKLAFAIFEEATMGARRSIARRIAHDLMAEVRFAGETYLPPTPSLLGTPAPAIPAEGTEKEDDGAGNH